MKNILFILLSIFTIGCTSINEKIDENSTTLPAIFPDYVEVTIPFNIAPLNFSANSPKEEIISALIESPKSQLKIKAKKGFINIPQKKWKDILTESKGDSIKITVVSHLNGKNIQYKPFSIYVSPEAIDRYIAYRLIEPLYAIWHEMGIYQRDLETFEQTAIYENKLTDHNCVNCHSFCMQSADKMLFHMRGDYNGTVFMNGDDIEFVIPKTKETSTLVYPFWHPSGKFVAFSTNDTYQILHPSQRVEVYDMSSNVVVYDIDNHSILLNTKLFGTDSFETFPTFSPDGKQLYYCSAEPVVMPDSIHQLKYSLCSISFDATTKSFGETDTLYYASKEGGSISFPRISPDGRFLMYTHSGYATFPIWHDDADLYMLDLQTKEKKHLTLANSNKSD
ncbi:MAG: hypothetical protein Q4A54_10710, partial [Parabacteroides sp.]|nr:hypothetical protein [Parabacteroides sp.]